MCMDDSEEIVGTRVYAYKRLSEIFGKTCLVVGAEGQSSFTEGKRDECGPTLVDA